ncbi:MAG TPA: NAD(P)-binding protein, partial [Telluria sp.]|nr:NAD(P)-binding protein [Telluria sp.]
MAQVQKIAILGGGAGAMAAAWYLSSQPGWRERYAITVYQQGWRLGGKGASGRNARLAQRIEEHGLHIWFGFYANAFAMMRAAYAELGRPVGAPLARWDEAFRPHDYVALMDEQGGAWQPWHLVLPRRDGEPGTGSEPVTPWAMALEAIRTLRRWHGALRTLAPGAAEGAPYDALLALAGALPPDARDHTDRDRELLARAIDRIHAHLAAQASFAVAGGELQRLLVALNIGATVLRGMLADGIFARGFSVANDEDLRGWLARHGGDMELCVNATPVRAMYDLLFAYVGGDPARPNLEAGTALRWALRMAFAYRGSVMYKMQAGMGDAVFAPLYEVLARRGVRFSFFHRVEEIVPAAGGVAALRFTVQAATKGGYRPLVNVKGLPCWPAAPDYAQLDPLQGALMQEHHADLESHWSDWPRLYREAFG